MRGVKATGASCFSKIMQEYGGYLPLELPRKNEYFSWIREDDILRLNCGRSTFYCAAVCLNVKKIYVPYLNCKNSVDPFEKLGIEYEYYFLNDDLMPDIKEINSDEAVLWINYYGNATEEQKKVVIQKYDKLIIDNCHAFYSQPVLKEGVYNCYSTRKFFGVADGAYLIGKAFEEFNLEESFSYNTSEFLMKTIEVGTNAAYKDSLDNENNIAKEIKKMSKLTRRILASIDYEEIQKIRKNNLCRLHKHLNRINEFNVNTNFDTQIYYPLLVINDSLRSKLIANHIYTPTWWRHVPCLCGEKKIETILSRYMIMLPIDQRYTVDDMDDLAQVVMRCM